ncbi:hypothetical protein D3C77_568580 [compost metagenome]
MVVRAVIGVHQVAQPHVRALQCRWRIADQRLAALADIGKLQLAFRRVALKPEYQTGYVTGDPLEPGLALAQGCQGTAAFSDVSEKYHQVLGIAKAQETQ